jgi:hypothetical protein
MTTYSFGGTTLYTGGGFQYLSLPDIKYTGRLTVDGDDDSFRHQMNSDFSEYGPAAGAGIETAVGYWNGRRVTAGVKGFYIGSRMTTVAVASRAQTTRFARRSFHRA